MACSAVCTCTKIHAYTHIHILIQTHAHPTPLTPPPPDGQHIGTINPALDAPDAAAFDAAAFDGGGALQAAAPPFDPSAINPRWGLDARALLRAREVQFVADEGEGEEAEDVAKEALKSVCLLYTSRRG